ncbi:MAG: GNAT family N-acetyltransferase [Calditrichaeota bacterium]|nr:GNAT family N-acetyltransferase [Calditrichota bacterium]
MNIYKSFLETQRLRLRPFEMNDAERVAELANDYSIYEMTLRLPHPYTRHDAEQWIAMHPQLRESGTETPFAIILKQVNALVGSISLKDFDPHNKSAEIGYWIGRTWWNKGIVTEAAQRLLKYGFEELGLNRIHGNFIPKNVASQKVMEKIGMSREGLLRQKVLKDGVFEDIVMYSILAEEYFKMKKPEI